MQYLIMILIVLGLAISDYLTGLMKAYCKNDFSSKMMRKGGLNKLGELLVMCTACGLEIGIEQLGRYYQSAELAAIAGTITAGFVFVYIVLMELVSILENYAAINSDAVWVGNLIKKLRNFENTESKQEEKEE